MKVPTAHRNLGAEGEARQIFGGAIVPQASTGAIPDDNTLLLIIINHHRQS